MAAKTNNFKIGIFILVAVVLFIAGLLAFGAKSFFTPKTRFETGIEGDVSGLSLGSSVQLRGVPIGQVTRITFGFHAYPGSKSHLLIVEFEVDGEELPWPSKNIKDLVNQAVGQGLRAIVKGQGITGTSILSLETLNPAPEPPPLDYAPRYYYIPSAPSQFSRMLETIEKSLVNIQKIDFAAIGAGVTNALDGVRHLADKLNNLDLETITTNANSVLVQVKSTAAKAQDAVTEIQSTIKSMKLDAVSDNANSLLKELNQTALRLQTLTSKINTLPMNDTLSELQRTLATLNEVLLELKRYPAGFFLGEPPAPIKTIQPVKER